MAQNTRTVTMKGNPLPLEGTLPEIGKPAPDFEASANDLSPVTLGSLKGKTLVLVSVPSLDTPVCDMEVRRFNKEAANLDDNVKIVTLSMDLPFAQARWCGAAGVEQVRTLSDYRTASFGQAYGVLIGALRLLARAIFIVDADGILRYCQVVPEVTSEPNYEDVLAALKNL